MSLEKIMKKTGYGFYPNVSSEVRSTLKKIYRSEGLLSEFKSSPWQTIWLSLVAEGAIDYDISTIVCFMENHWKKNPVCLIPESSQLIDSLSRIKIEGQLNNIRTPADVFTIAIPKGVLFNNQRIEGCLIAKVDRLTSDKMVIDMAKEYGGGLYDNPSSQWDFKTEKFTVTYKDCKTNARLIVNVSVEKLTDVLMSANYEEYSAKVGRDGSSGYLSDDELTTQYEVLRFVLSLLVYMGSDANATRKVDSIFVNNPGGENKIKQNAIQINSMKIKDGIQPHYRQLRHNRFYQGDWAEWESGSRFVPVNMDLSLIEDSTAHA